MGVVSLRLLGVGTAQELRVSQARGRAVVAIDTLRAATTAAAALASGALAVRPVAEVEAAFALRGALPNAVLGGERAMRAVPGFDAGNSPRDYPPGLVAGREVILTTTNGTLALGRAHAAGALAFAALTSAPLAAQWLLAQDAAEALVVMSGTDGHFAYEDALTAGLIASALPAAELDDLMLTALAAYEARRGALRAALMATPHGRRLVAAGFAEDIDRAAAAGASPVLPVRDSADRARLIAWQPS